MSWLRMAISRCLAMFRGRTLERDLDEELRSHLEMAVEENRQRGMSEGEARRAALRSFGGVTQVRETVRVGQGLPFLENLRRDFGYALRQMRKSPGFAAVTVLTLALGIGANTAIFLLTYSVLLKGLPVPHPGQLVLYRFAKGDTTLGLSYNLYEALRERQTATSDVFAWASDATKVVENGHAELVPMAIATGSIFRTLELHPYLGHGFDEQAGERGQPLRPEALISYNFWRTHFHGDAGVLGHTLRIDNTDVPIIGVLPRGFDGISPEEHIGILLPLSFERVLHPSGAMIDNPGAVWLQVMGRLKPGVTLAQARAALSASDRQITDAADPQHMFLGTGLFGDFKLAVEPGRNGASTLRTEYGKPLLALEALCGLMMLLCAVNTALLILSRVSGRLHEFAVRSALGAARSRLIAQVLMETALLAIAGLLFGVALGWALARALVTMLTPIGHPALIDVRAGAGVVFFAIGLSIAAALLAGLWPAFRASRTAPGLDLKQAHAQRQAGSLGRWIIPTQVALGVLLIHAALLLTATFTDYAKNTAGFSNGVTFVRLRLENDNWNDQTQARKTLEIAEDLENTPGIRSAALMNMLPMHNFLSTSNYFSRDPQGNVHQNRQVWLQEVTPGYFPAVGTAVLQGRAFARSDIAGDAVCVISQSAAAYFFPGEDAVGRTITAGQSDGDPKHQSPCRVIGIAQDARLESLLQPAPMAVYALIEQEHTSFPNSILAVRASSYGLAAEAVRREAAKLLPAAPPPTLETFDQLVDENLSQQRLLSSVSGGFALLALALVAAGLYGVLSRAVTERRREIGIRMALGAQRDRIVAVLARGAAVRVAIGVVAGAALALMTAHLLQSLLYGVSVGSFGVALATLGILLGVLMLAFVIPASRAASIDPMEAIREE